MRSWQHGNLKIKISVLSISKNSKEAEFVDPPQDGVTKRTKAQLPFLKQDIELGFLFSFGNADVIFVRACICTVHATSFVIDPTRDGDWYDL